MDTANTQVMSIRLSSEELQKIDAGAAAAGMSRPEYARSKLLAPAIELPASNLQARLEKLEALVKHGIYITNQVYVALYAIAEAEGKTGHFLTAKQLDEVYDRVRADALVYAVEFPNSFAAVQAEIAAMSKKKSA